MTFHDYADTDSEFGFERIQYEGYSAHSDPPRGVGALAPAGASRRRRSRKISRFPYFMLPSLGSGSTLRAFSSWRFRDRNSLLLQGSGA